MNSQRIPTRRVIRRCPFCGARITLQDEQCPICGQHMLSTSASNFSPQGTVEPAQTHNKQQLQLPSPRMLSVSRRMMTRPQVQPRHARKVTIRVEDPNRYPGPFEVTYLQCPNCGSRAHVNEVFCGTCSYPLTVQEPVQTEPKPIAAWSPRLQRPMSPAHFEAPQDQVALGDNRYPLLGSYAKPMPTSAANDTAQEAARTPQGRLSPADIGAQFTVLGMVALISLAGFWLFQINQTSASAETPKTAITHTPPIATVGGNVRQSSVSKSTANTTTPRQASLTTPITPSTTAISIVKTSTTTLKANPISKSIAYVVQPGDSCISIASLFSISVAELIAHNKLDNGACLLRAGSRIYIPATNESGVASSPAKLTTAGAPDAPTIVYAEPKLVGPPDNAKAEGEQRMANLSWTSSIALADNEYFVVHIQSAGGMGTTQFRTKLAALMLRPDMLPNASVSNFVWWVSIQNVAQDSKSAQIVNRDVSPSSEARRFSW
jgi:rRNA maturation protein Nop10/LysM repeat protein